MDIYKSICKHIVIPLWAKWERTQYLEYYKYLVKSQYFSEEKIREIQWGKIKKLLHHAYNNCKFYKKSFDDSGITPEDIKNIEDYPAVPILKKSDVHEYSDEISAPNIDRYRGFLTSGSTGKPLKGFMNKESSELKRACAVRSNSWSGYELGERVYQLYGDPFKELSGLNKFRAKVRGKFLSRIEVLDLLSLNEKTMIDFAMKMQKRPPSLLWGHAHGLYTLAKFFEKKGITNIRPKGIYSAGMVLHNFERQKVEEVFKCKFQDRYGCEEFGLIAGECKMQEGLHVNTDSLYVELIGKDDKPVAAGERGAIVITDLTNLAMPFIRYKIEDVGVLSERKCSCGRTQPLIEKIEGRIADFLVTPDGDLVSGISLTDHFAGYIPGVAQIQIVQKKINMLVLNIVKKDEFSKESEEKIEELIKDFFGEKMCFEYDYTDHIPKGPRGKYRFTICEVSHELL